MNNPFLGAHYVWPYVRESHAFSVHVIEPLEYQPASHADLFGEVITELFTGSQPIFDEFEPITNAATTAAFDLVTFPEAFVPTDTLITVLTSLATLQNFGCIHVGLRPDHGDNHLFDTSQVRSLVDQISKALTTLDEGDFTQFKTWLSTQPDGLHFNIACLFTVDAKGALRICLHPKLVRSRFEVNPFEEAHMHEANLLSLVTLQPTNPCYKTVTIQPLICADALNLSTDRGVLTPLAATQQHIDCFGASPPDHVDIISLATCTPQQDLPSNTSGKYRSWHEEYLEIFKSVPKLQNFSRHNSSVIILANFQQINRSPGGISGAFLPISHFKDKVHSSLQQTCWGRPSKGLQNRWSEPDEDLNGWQTLGHLTGLKPISPSSETKVRIFSFSLHRLLRENPYWG